ncbi:MAG: DUF4491 family protein [Anaerolineales bacterium]|nr:DUF4491 family protein [Anaerolineales bacterium]
MTLFGPALGIVTLLVIGMGFVWVVRAEYYFGYLWWPYVMGAGTALVVASLFVPSVWVSALLGVLGASLVWGSTELKNQAVRTELGWFPFNAGQKLQPPFADRIRRWGAPAL